MSYEEEIEIVEGTFGKEVYLQAQDADGNGIPLTGCVVKWVIFESEDSIAAILNVTCTDVNLSEGKVKYGLLESDWGEEKLHYRGEKEEDKYTSSLVATKTGYREEFPDLKVKIKKKAPA